MPSIDKNAHELWDIFDDNRNPTGRTVTRGTALGDNENHLVAICYLVNSKGKLLFTRRAKSKVMAGYWECPGGGVLSGEDTLTAAIRETLEEVGIAVRAEDATLYSTIHADHTFYDNWLFPCDVSIDQLVLQESEVDAAKWVSAAEFARMEREHTVLEGIDYFALLES
ncbi:MAG: NUDIX domain-containing protein [Ruminococcaceae bacterium]|nr:NUDIX domain-containing protein [Oscillospiraceae bacterium]